MIELTGERLTGLGYRGLTKQQMNELLRELYNAGEEIVGMKLVSEMSNDQLDAFEQFVAADDQAGAFAWLERNFPNYREVVQETFAELDELLRRAAAETRPEAQMPPHPLADLKSSENDVDADSE